VLQGELLLEDTESQKTLTKLPFQKILALFVIEHISITTPLIEKCTQHGISLVVMKSNFRPVFFFSVTSEANITLKYYKP
jgi:CRISPR/Cas system-associated endonuclease Cas1